MTGPAGRLAAWTLARHVRQRPFHVARSSVVACSLVLLAGSVASAAQVGAAGQAMLQILFWLTWAAVLLFGAATFGPMLAAEREEGTLPLLRLTGHSTGTLLVGKTAGALWTFVSFVLVQVPFSMLSVTLGGASATQALLTFAVQVAHAVRTFGVALLCSSLARTATGGARLAAFALAVLELGPWLLAKLGGVSGAGAIAAHASSHTIAQGLLASEVPLAATLRGIGALVLTGAVCVVATAACFARTPVAAPARDSAPPRRRHPRPVRGVEAIAWRDFHFEQDGWGGLVRFTILVVVAGLVSPWLGLAAGLLLLAAEAANSLYRERIHGTLPLLATLPLDASAWLAAKRRTAWQRVAILAVLSLAGHLLPSWRASSACGIVNPLTIVPLAGVVVMTAQNRGLAAARWPLVSTLVGLVANLFGLTCTGFICLQAERPAWIAVPVLLPVLALLFVNTYPPLIERTVREQAARAP